MSQPEYPPLPLKSLLAQVRTELEEAVAERKKAGRAPMFRVEDITLEINVTVKREESITGEMTGKLVVAEFKGEGRKTTGAEQVHKVTIRLTAHETEEADDGSLYPLIKSGLMAGGFSKSKPISLGKPITLDDLDTKLGLTPKQSSLFGKLVRGKYVYVTPTKFPSTDQPAP